MSKLASLLLTVILSSFLFSAKVMAVPSTPGAPTAVLSGTTLTLSWIRNLTVDSYNIEYRDGFGSWRSFGNSTNRTGDQWTNQTGLVNRSFQIQACSNESGCSGWSGASNPVTSSAPPTVPNVPSISMAAQGYVGESFNISFNLLADATSYKLYNGSGSLLTTVSSSPIPRTISTEGSYTFKLTACNTVGCSDFSTSDTINIVDPTPAAPTSAPTLTSATTQNATTTTGTINVSWTPVAGYYHKVRYINGPDGVSSAWTSAGSSKSYSGLFLGTYTFQARACALLTDDNTCGPTDSQNITLNYTSTASISGPHTSRGSYRLDFSASGAANYYKVWENGGSPIDSNSGSYKDFNHGNGGYNYYIQSCVSLGGVEKCSPNSANHTVTVLKVPGVPASISASSTNNTGSVAVSWGAASGTVHNYKVYKKLGTGSWSSAVNKNTSTSHTFTGLTDGSYQFKVEACNTLGSEGCSTAATSGTTLVALKPGTPGAFSAIPSPDTDGSYTVVWGAENTGRADKYELYRNTNGTWSNTAIQNSNALSKPESGLANGTYQYRVRACNTQGIFKSCSGYSTSSPVVVSPPKPSTAPAMQSLTTQYTDTTTGSITLLWTPVAGYPHRYKYKDLTDNSETSWTSISGSSKTFPGLYLGSYLFSIEACLDITVDSSCGPTGKQTLTLEYQSSAVITLTLPATSRGAYTLSWSPNRPHIYIKENGSEIESDYQLSSKTFPSQSDGTYDYRVNGCLDVQTDAPIACTGYSDTKSVTVLKIPGIPASIAASSTNNTGSVAVSWGAASGNVHNYKVYKKQGTGNWSSAVNKNTATSHTFTGLGDGSYQFKVEACNTLGSEGCSTAATSGTTLVALKPNQPGAFTAIPSPDTDGSYTVVWGAENTGRADKYELYRNTNGTWSNTAIQNSNALSKPESGLANGTYQYRVRACNTEGTFTSCSSYSTSSPVVVSPPKPSTAPGMNSDLTQYTDTTTGAITLKWTAVPGYPHRYKYKDLTDNSETSWTSISGSSKTFPGLYLGSYLFSIEACLDITVDSSCGPTGTQTIALEYQSSAVITATLSDTSRGAYTLSWSPNRPHIYIEENSLEIESDYQGSSKDFSNQNDGTYNYRVNGCLDVDTDGPIACTGYSGTKSVTVLKIPGIPASITPPATNNTGSVAVSWGAASGAVHNYKVYKKLGTGSWSSAVNKNTSTSHTFTGLSDGSYQFKVEACNTLAGNEDCSSPLTSTTNTIVALKPATPGAFTPVASPDSDGAFRLSWGAESSGAADQYRLYKRTVPATAWGANIHNGSLTTYKDISGLDNGTYEFMVEACNTESTFISCSAQVQSAQITVQPPKPTTAPTITSASRKDIEDLSSPVTVTWNAVSSYPHRIKYLDKASNNAESQWYSSTTGSMTFPDPLFVGDFTFTVEACVDTSDDNSCGPPGTQEFTLAYTTTMQAIVDKPYSRGSYRLTWSPARDYIYIKENGTKDIPYDNIEGYVDFTGMADGTYGYQVNGCKTPPGDDHPACSGYSGTTTVNVLNPPANQGVPTVPANSSDGNVAVTWNTPATGEVHRYKVAMRAVGGDWQTAVDRGTNRFNTFNNVPKGSYEFMVSACNTLNNVEECTDSAASVVVPVVAMPGIPGAFTAIASPDEDGSFDLVWGNATDLETGFQYELYRHNGSVWETTAIYTGTATTFSETTPGNGTFKYRVRACNSEGTFIPCSDYQESAEVIVSQNAPGKPSATGDGTTNTLSWEELADHFEVDIQLDGGEWINDSQTYTASPATWENLNVGSRKYRIRACTVDNLCSENSPESDAVVTLATPLKPFATGVDTTNTLVWDVLADHYEVDIQLDGGEWINDSQTYTASPASWENLIAGSRKYRIRACTVDNLCSDNSPESDVVVTNTTTSDYINFNDYVVGTLNAANDIDGTVEKRDGGYSLYLQGNLWKQISYPYTVTANTILEFDFQSTEVGQQHSIGLIESLSDNIGTRKIQLFGNEHYGILDYLNYSLVDGVKHYRIPIGQYYTGSFNYLFFIMDEDTAGNTTANSTFSNIEIYEDELVDISYPGSGEGESTTTADSFIASAIPTPGNENNIQTVEFSIDGTNWFTATLVDGVYQYDFGNLLVGEYTLSTRTTDVDGIQTLTTVDFAVLPVELLYEYDALGRLRAVNSSNGSTRTYTYDDAGNRTTTGSGN